MIPSISNSLLMGVVGMSKSGFNILPIGEYDASQGGFFGGFVVYPNGDFYAVYWADKSFEISAQWKTENTSTAGTDSLYDGFENTLAMTATPALRDLHPAATHCVNCTAGGKTDWYLLSQHELSAAGYVPLKPSTQSNNTSYGINPIEFPTARNDSYSSGHPGQTRAELFKTGGAQAFQTERYWTSTQYSAPYARLQNFTTGPQTTSSKGNSAVVRPARRVKLN